MSDALCGPSNPLQQFKQQTQLDRSLQQDRLASRQTPGQGFRSQPANAGILDPEFEAFQAGVAAPSDLPQFHQPFHHPLPGPSQATPGWAADFQRMNISAPPPPVFAPQQQQATSTAGWAQGFREHIAPRAQTSTFSPQTFQHRARYGMGGAFPAPYAQQQQPSFAPAKGKEPMVEQFDESAFALAFDQAQRDMLDSSMPVEEDMEVEGERTGAYENGAATADYEVDHVDQARREAMAAIRGHQRRLSQEMEAAQNLVNHLSGRQGLEQLPDAAIEEEETAILEEEGEQSLQQQEEQEQQQQQDDDDALAQTAQELLQKIEHNQTEKFRNSHFLQLMRKLRDREVKVEGDKMVETATSTSVRAIPALIPHDSTYGSGTSTPSAPALAQAPSFHKHDDIPAPRKGREPELDTHIEHWYHHSSHEHEHEHEYEFDHWESPYR